MNRPGPSALCCAGGPGFALYSIDQPFQFWRNLDSGGFLGAARGE